MITTAERNTFSASRLTPLASRLVKIGGKNVSR